MHEETVDTETIYSGRIVGLDKVTVRLEDGTESFREVVRHNGAIAAMVRHRKGPFIFVRQFRKPVDEEVLEIVAGTLDPEEEPEACARREIREETGYTVDHLFSLGLLYPTPGYSSERIHVFYAEVDGVPGATDQDHDENVKVVEMDVDQVSAGIRDGSILDGKTLAAWARYQMRAAELGVN
jgi:ADP-ribose pyrophosphatase